MEKYYIAKTVRGHFVLLRHSTNFFGPPEWHIIDSSNELKADNIGTTIVDSVNHPLRKVANVREFIDRAIFFNIPGGLAWTAAITEVYGLPEDLAKVLPDETHHVEIAKHSERIMNYLDVNRYLEKENTT